MCAVSFWSIHLPRSHLLAWCCSAAQDAGKNNCYKHKFNWLFLRLHISQDRFHWSGALPALPKFTIPTTLTWHCPFTRSLIKLYFFLSYWMSGVLDPPPSPRLLVLYHSFLPLSSFLKQQKDVLSRMYWDIHLFNGKEMLSLFPGFVLQTAAAEGAGGKGASWVGGGEVLAAPHSRGPAVPARGTTAKAVWGRETRNPCEAVHKHTEQFCFSRGWVLPEPEELGMQITLWYEF